MTTSLPPQSLSADLALTTQRLGLRPVAPPDAGALYALFSDPAVVRYWSSPPWTSPEQATEMIRREDAGLAEGSSVRLAVVRREDDALVGTFSIFSLDPVNRRAEIGYAMAPSVWGRGYAQEAGRAVIGHAFGVLGLNRLEADVDPRNEASARVVQRLGFRREGLLRERWIVAGEVSDSAMYGLLRREWAG